MILSNLLFLPGIVSSIEKNERVELVIFLIAMIAENRKGNTEGVNKMGLMPLRELSFHSIIPTFLPSEDLLIFILCQALCWGPLSIQRLIGYSPYRGPYSPYKVLGLMGLKQTY